MFHLIKRSDLLITRKNEEPMRFLLIIKRSLESTNKQCRNNEVFYRNNDIFSRDFSLLISLCALFIFHKFPVPAHRPYVQNERTKGHEKWV